MDPRQSATLPYVGLEHIGVGTLQLVGHGTCADVVSAVQRVKPGETIFGSLRPYFRKVVRATSPLACTPEAWVLGAAAGVDPHFLFYVVANPEFVDACAAAATGTRMPRAEWAFAEGLPIPLPPLAEQRRIAAVLAALDEKIALNRDVNRTLEALAGALFGARFVDFEGMSDLVPSDLGPIPRGWRVAGLDGVADCVRDAVEPAEVEGDVPYVGLEHVPRRSAALLEWGRAADAASLKGVFRRGDLLFGKLRPYFHKVVPVAMDGVASTDILIVRPRADVWRWFAFGHLSSDALVAHAAAGSDGTRMPRTRWSDLCRWRFALPPVAVAADFQAQVDPLYQRIFANVAESRAMATLRDTLLPRLLSGEARVE